MFLILKDKDKNQNHFFLTREKDGSFTLQYDYSEGNFKKRDIIELIKFLQEGIK